jgi:hypothetical protein
MNVLRLNPIFYHPQPVALRKHFKVHKPSTSLYLTTLIRIHSIFYIFVIEA